MVQVVKVVHKVVLAVNKVDLEDLVANKVVPEVVVVLVVVSRVDPEE